MPVRTRARARPDDASESKNWRDRFSAAGRGNMPVVSAHASWLVSVLSLVVIGTVIALFLTGVLGVAG
jgi:hypothetical protein